jgi:cytochrome oxidase Cu insertion factor (SCO1/SenC/PrrC family)
VQRNTRNIFGAVLVLLITCGVAASQPSQESQESQNKKTAATPTVEVEIGGVGKVKIPDLDVRDQDGRKIRFYSDLIKDKVVVLSFFYTSCSNSCTLQGQTFSKLQSLLGDRLGKSVFLISVTTDPARDDSEKLKSWGKRYDVQDGWTLVTGKEAELNKLLLPFTGMRAGAGLHLPATFVGNQKTGVWTSASGVFDPQALLDAVDFVTRESAASRP